MTGSVRPGEDGRLAFTLRLTFHPVDRIGKVLAGRTEIVALAGTVAFVNRRRAMPDTFDLVGWKLLRNNQELAPASTLDEARRIAVQ
jgi:hypothetical protein